MQYSTILVLLLNLLLAADTLAKVTIRKTGLPPTGYEVDFEYVNKTASRILIGGGIYPFTDQFHTTLQDSGRYDPHDYKPGDFYVSVRSFPDNYSWPYEMSLAGSSHGHGDDERHVRESLWTFTTPLPSGIYSYAFLVDCNYAPNCSIDTGNLVIDPDNPPFLNVQGDQVASSFQVPFDPVFQGAGMDTNFDYALTAPPHHRGTVTSVNYTSPGSIHPAPDVHHFGLYLPPGYGKHAGGKKREPDGKEKKKKYPLLYLSHGAGGNGNDWENLGRMSSIMDNLILEGHIPPTVVVMPSFYNLDDSLPRFIYGNKSNNAPAPPSQAVRENFERYLFPWVEANLDVCDEPACRAFAGLSMGGKLAYEMYVNATSYFSYFGLFSAATSKPYIDAASVGRNPRLKEVGVFVAYGLYDFLFDAGRELEGALNSAEVGFVNRITPFGSHYWNTWQDALWWFGIKALWKDLPFNASTGR
ncbi:carbohydrate esterase family 1 protein [Xylariomycetidae sp. FL2044]|nr:carbohydrate esterase family 1 protein [Xylariomycetidae sp. FL2044]